jgi:Activator of aromatic catabolism
MSKDKEIIRLEKENKVLKKELASFKKLLTKPTNKLKTVLVPKALQPIFDLAESSVGTYHNSLIIDPEKASIEISGQRYLLLRASALSIEFLEGIMKYYRDRGEKEALSIGKNILFDLAHLIGYEDAANFSKLMGLKKPIEMLSAGPVHFAYTGWAQVKLNEGSNQVLIKTLS